MNDREGFTVELGFTFHYKKETDQSNLDEKFEVGVFGEQPLQKLDAAAISRPIEKTILSHLFLH